MKDIEITRRLCKPCDIVSINILDHIIVGYGGIQFQSEADDLLRYIK